MVQGLGGTESLHAGITPAGACERETACGQEEPRQPQRPVSQCHALSLPVCARRHGEIKCKLLSSVKGTQFLFAVLCLRKACYSRVTPTSLPQLGPLQAFQPILVAPSPGKAVDPVHQFYIKAAGRACCWSEKQSASFCCFCQYRKDLLLLTVPCERVLSLHSSCYFLHLFLLNLMCFGAEFLSFKPAA